MPKAPLRPATPVNTEIPKNSRAENHEAIPEDDDEVYDPDSDP